MNSLPLNSAADIKRDKPRKSREQVERFDREYREFEQNRHLYRCIEPKHGDCKWLYRDWRRKKAHTVDTLKAARDLRIETTGR